MPVRQSQSMFRCGVLACLLGGALAGQSTVAGQSSVAEPVRVAYECTEDDAAAFGLNCTPEDPCPVFLELAAAEATAGRLIATGNLHTKSATLYGIVLASENDGATWTEPLPRLPNTLLEQIQFSGTQNGWITGVTVDPLARNPFLLITSDAGRNWRQKPVVEDTKYATIAQLHFDSASHGELVLDVAQPKTVRQEWYETQTGGDSWELKQVDNKPIPWKYARPASTLRVRADASTGTFVIERGSGKAWKTVASFLVHVADCE